MLKIIGSENMDEYNLNKIWRELSVEISIDSGGRVLRGISDSGIYAAWNIRNQSKEILIGLDDSLPKSIIPNWNGMEITVRDDIRTANSNLHLVLELLDDELQEVFVVFCLDALHSIKKCSEKERKEKLMNFIERWDRFFQRSGNKPLSPERQRGLFAELWWLRKLLKNKMDAVKALTSWKGSERAFHDFEHEGIVVEIKSTIRKEPRKVMISNERQLDNHGISSLHLFVLTLNIQEKGESLPDIISDIRKIINKSSTSLHLLLRKLTLARYLDCDAEKYDSKYQPRLEELFEVRDGFPRIITLPNGTGDLKYSIQISSCEDYKCEIKDYLEGL